MGSVGIVVVGHTGQVVVVVEVEVLVVVVAHLSGWQHTPPQGQWRLSHPGSGSQARLSGVHAKPVPA